MNRIGNWAREITVINEKSYFLEVVQIVSEDPNLRNEKDIEYIFSWICEKSSFPVLNSEG